LSETEAEQLQAAGTDLQIILAPRAFVIGDALIFSQYAPLVNWADYTDNIRKYARAQNLPRTRNYWFDIAEEAKQLGQGEGYYSMNGKCGNWQEDGRCGDYENRPKICRAFPVGQQACKGFRERAGVDVFVEIRQRSEPRREPMPAYF